MVKKSFVINRAVNSVCHTTDKHNVDIEEAIDLAGLGCYNYTVLITCCIIHFGSIIDMLGYSLIVPSASCDLQLSLEDSGLLTSISFAGFLFALPWGYTADTQGRRRMLLISSSVGFFISFLTSFSTNFYMMLVLKFLATSFSTSSLALAIIYLGECTPQKVRNRFLFILNIFNFGVDFAYYVLAYFILPLEFNIPILWLSSFRPWRLLSILMAVPLGLGAFILCFLKESPKFLNNLGKTDHALNVLKSTYEINAGRSAIYTVKSLVTVDAPKTAIILGVSTKTNGANFPSAITLENVTNVFAVFNCLQNNVFFMWFPTMVNSFYTTSTEGASFCERIVANITPDVSNDTCTSIKTPINTIYVGMIFTLFFTFMNIIIIAFSNWRRFLLISTFLVSGVSCILVDMFHQPVVSVIIFIAIQCTGICFGIVGSYYIDIFPTSYSGVATSLGTMVARFVTLGGVNIVAATIIEYCRLTFYCWSIFVFSGILAAFFLPAEPKSNSSPQN